MHLAMASVNPTSTPYRFYQCTLPNNSEMVWKCAHAGEKALDRDSKGLFTAVGYDMANYTSLTTSFSLPFYNEIMRNSCFASRKYAQPIVLNVGVKAWAPDSLDPLFVAGRLPGGVLFEKLNGTNENK